MSTTNNTKTPAPADASAGGTSTGMGTGESGSSGSGSGNGTSTRNSRRNRGRSRASNYQQSTFKGAIAGVDTLATKAEKRGIEFASFLKSLHLHVITTFKNPKDIAVAVTDFKDPLMDMARDLPTVAKTKASLGVTTEPPVAGESDVDEAAREERNAEAMEPVKDLQRAEMKIFAERRRSASSNLTALWGVIMGQCTPASKKS